MMVKTALEAFIKGARGEKLTGLPSRSARDAWSAGKRVSSFFGDGPLTEECLNKVFNEWSRAVEECDSLQYKIDTPSECEHYYRLEGFADGLSVVYAEGVPTAFLEAYVSGRDFGFAKVCSIVNDHRG